MFDVSFTQKPAKRGTEQYARNRDEQHREEMIRDEVRGTSRLFDLPKPRNKKARQGKDKSSRDHGAGRHAGGGHINFIDVTLPEKTHQSERENRSKNGGPGQGTCAKCHIGR